MDCDNQDSEKRRELMDYATRLLDERRLGFKEGYEKENVKLERKWLKI